MRKHPKARHAKINFLNPESPPTEPDGYTGVTFVRDALGNIRAMVPESGGDGSSSYLVVFALQGKPPDNTTFPIIVFNQSVSFAANFSSSYGKVLTNPASTAVYTVKKNGSQIGTVSISTGGVFTFATSGGTAQSFSAGDYMTIVTPTPQDASLSDVMMTLTGTR